MIATRIMPLHTGKDRGAGNAIRDIPDYVENSDKIDQGRFTTAHGCNSLIADAEFLLNKQQYLAGTGRRRGADDMVAHHVRRAFIPGEVTPEKADRVGAEFAKHFTEGNYAFIVRTHISHAHVHSHIIWNSTSLDCTREFRNLWDSIHAVRRLGDTLCIENGLSIVENPKPGGQAYNKWLGEQVKPSHRELLRQTIDRAMGHRPENLDVLLDLLWNAGREVSKRGITYHLKLPSWEKAARLGSLGDDYIPKTPLEIFAGQRTYTPGRRQAVQTMRSSVNLLVNIQAKLCVGKGTGYARWASKFNLKQMTQTLNYLSDHGLLDYKVPAERTVVATTRHNELSRKIEAAEKHMVEVAVL